MCSPSSKFYLKEWKSLKRWCANKEALPKFKNFDDFRAWYHSHAYYGGHTHPFKFITLSGELVAIDLPFAELIQKLNESGYFTRFCCCGHKDVSNYVGYIYFDTSDIGDLKKLENIKTFGSLNDSVIEFFLDHDDIIRFCPKSKINGKTEKEYYSRLCQIILKTLKV